MTKSEFKNRWESDENGGGITFDDIAKCAEDWGIARYPRTRPINVIRYQVLKVADVYDAEEFRP